MAPLQTVSHSGNPIDMTSLFGEGSFTGSNGVRLVYRLFLPNGYDAKKEYPLILFMHGAGERGTDNRQQLRGFAEAFRHEASPIYQCIVLAPQCPLDKKWVNVPKWHNYSVDEIAESEEIQVVLELLAATRCSYRVDPDRVYCTGLSMGGFATWDMSVRHPELFCAIAPVCGGADDSSAAALKDLPIWTFHGDEDPTVPIEGTEKMVRALRAAGNTSVRYDVLQGMRHDIWKTVYARTELFTWMLSQKRSTVKNENT